MGWEEQDSVHDINCYALAFDIGRIGIIEDCLHLNYTFTRHVSSCAHNLHNRLQGNFIGVSLLNRKRDARIALAKTMRRLSEEKEAYQLLPIDEEDDDDDFPRFDNEFVRK